MSRLAVIGKPPHRVGFSDCPCRFWMGGTSDATESIMKKAVLLDFYGTVVEESYQVLSVIAEEFKSHGASSDKGKIEELWWSCFRAHCDVSYGAAFQTQKEIYLQVFREMAERTGASGIDFEALKEKIIAFSVTSPMFDDAKRFLAECPVPYYILSNIDNAEIGKIIAFHHLKPCGVFTSEDAREYKPRKGIFAKGLQFFGLHAADVVYAGDSFRNDYCGAQNAGITAVWLNRLRENRSGDYIRELPDLYSLLSLLPSL